LANGGNGDAHLRCFFFCYGTAHLTFIKKYDIIIGDIYNKITVGDFIFLLLDITSNARRCYMAALGQNHRSARVSLIYKSNRSVIAPIGFFVMMYIYKVKKNGEEGEKKKENSI
jgi:hypothetical protein